ncbi:hypothetical protein WA026_006108 [Henosepilachna vigintioctopunctata]|uniref:MYND-type domain-containing protein n=1 Tax=Henosepilachna vigintioctopunctata TaxID=420089 RepID=A0AAW1TMX7_9CUCU
MNNVDLGFLEPCENWQVESRVFPSKAGGKPAWLDLEGVPSGEDLKCSICKDIMVFLCQIYAPYEEDDNNFHRTLFIFVCRNENCCIRNESDNILILRSSLPKKNEFYSSEPPSEAPDPEFSLLKWLVLCEVCGCKGNKKCSRCEVTYCSRQHQVIDWKENHKKYCGVNNFHDNFSKALFPQFEIIIEPEGMNDSKVDEEIEMKKFTELSSDGKLGTMSGISEEELVSYSATEHDKIFSKFRKHINNNPEQVLRYSRGGQPLLISSEVIPKDIPDCEYCGSSRQFEFQVMPQMLTLLKDCTLDWGVLLFYTCKRSCVDKNVNYRKEFVVKQDVSPDNIE